MHDSQTDPASLSLIIASACSIVSTYFYGLNVFRLVSEPLLFILIEMISITGAEDIAAVEERLADFEHRPSQVIRIEIAKDVQNPEAGAEAALIQFLLTWSRRAENAEVTTDIPQGSTVDGKLSRLCDSHYGLIALLAAARLSRAKGEAITIEAQRYAQTVYTKIARKPRSDGRRALFLVAEEQGTIDDINAYNRISVRPSHPDKVARFKRLLSDEIKRCAQESEAKPLRVDDKEIVAEIVYELFANAEDWGTSGISGGTVRPRIRGVMMSAQERGADTDSTQGQHSSGPIGEYITRYEEKSHRTLSAYLEVSVFDSGIGLAQRFNNRLTDQRTRTGD